MPRAGLAGLPTDPAARVPIVPTAIPLRPRPRRCLVAPSNARGRRGGVSSGHGWAGGAGLCRGRHRCCRGRPQGWDRFCQLRSRRWHHGWAIVAVNAMGSALDRLTGDLLDAAGASWTSSPRRRHPILRLLGPTGRSGTPLRSQRADGDDVGTATTIGVVATDATLTKTQCRKSLRREPRRRTRAPSRRCTRHTTGTRSSSRDRQAIARPSLDEVDLQSAAADCVSRAIVHAMLAATSIDRTAEGGLLAPAWSDRSRTGHTHTCSRARN